MLKHPQFVPYHCNFPGTIQTIGKQNKNENYNCRRSKLVPGFGSQFVQPMSTMHCRHNWRYFCCTLLKNSNLNYVACTILELCCSFCASFYELTVNLNLCLLQIISIYLKNSHPSWKIQFSRGCLFPCLCMWLPTWSLTVCSGSSAASSGGTSVTFLTMATAGNECSSKGTWRTWSNFSSQRKQSLRSFLMCSLSVKIISRGWTSHSCCCLQGSLWRGEMMISMK